MVLLLVSDIIDDVVQLRARIGKRAISLLPFKSPKNPSLLIDEFCRICFDVSHQIRYGGVWCYSNQDMDMVGHGIDLDDGLFFLFDDAHDIPVEFVFMLFWDEGLPAFKGEDDVYVDLRIGVGHDLPTEMSPLRGLVYFGYRYLQRCRPYGANIGV